MTAVLALLALVYAAIGVAYWLTLLWSTARTIRGVAVLERQSPPEPEHWPRLSIIVPACNEADTIPEAAASLLAQDYPDFEVIYVDDRSTDATPEVLDRLAADDRRVHVLHVDRLPERWLGKVHALWQGIAEAEGRWMLLTDADVRFAPDALRRAVAYAEHRELDHLACAPDLVAPTWGVEVMVQTFLRTFLAAVRPWAVRRADSRAYVGVGAFNLVRREAFDRTPGMEWLRLEVADDVGLGLMLKRHGARSELAASPELIRVAWYPDLRAAARGAEKGFASIGDCHVGRMLLLTAAIPPLELAPLILPLLALLAGGWVADVMWAAAVVTLLAAATSVVMLARWARRPWWPGLLLPAAAVINTWLLLRTTWLGWRRGGIVWRGTLYPSRLLRGKMRVRFP